MGVQIQATVPCLGETGASVLLLAAFSSSLRVFVEHGWCVTLGDWFRG